MMTLPAPAHLPLGSGCTPDHAVLDAPATWCAVAARLAGDGAHHRALVEAGDERGSERLADLLPPQDEAAAFLAGCDPAARRVALSLWAANGGLSVADVATATAAVLADDLRARP
ncbi:hypothetical protein ACI8AC_10235 [Geodermatophilus sp. SYSU D00758]